MTHIPCKAIISGKYTCFHAGGCVSCYRSSFIGTYSFFRTAAANACTEKIRLWHVSLTTVGLWGTCNRATYFWPQYASLLKVVGVVPQWPSPESWLVHIGGLTNDAQSNFAVEHRDRSTSYWILQMCVGLTMADCFVMQWCPCYGASWLSGSMRHVQARDRRFDRRLCWICCDVVLLGKALCSHMHSLDPGVSGYLVGQWRLACLNSSMCRKMAAGCMLPGELRWLMNEQILWPGGNCVKSGKWRFTLDTRL